ncbi:acyl-CoA thioesterase [Dokdonia sp. 4H-3-7-5]|uniref:acyl-CoA thioesterase n=1 Tax=Dokdonia sp. (strain 4H-3-7-5) TaxID=983548 RepID=UPI00020A7933|nr:thioesterase family protein [Dokdonia sp. 4H-3-7-5]AEE20969.1 thioesterase superfamily protein [Dokdonia sp. 4H-3-7-5]
MKNHITFVKVRYSETDQMGFVHHSNYAQYLEIARLEWLEQLGISYKWMEENGVMLPVYNLNTTFKKSALFDDCLKIETSLRNIPTVRIMFDYKVYNQNEELLTVASTELIFMNTKTGRPMRCPKYILEKL